jgi:hypothetical protein
MPATNALLQKASLDSLSSDEMSQLDLSIQEESEIKLAMLQQSMRSEMEIPEQFFQYGASLKAADSKAQGPRVVSLGPLDLQVDCEVFPEALSTLATDDVDKQRLAREIYALAMQNPRIWSLPKAAQLVAQTFRGHTAEELLNDPNKTPPPIPPLKLTVNWKDLTPEIQNNLLMRMGIMPGEGQQLAAEEDKLSKLRSAADHLAGLQQPVNPFEDLEMEFSE